MSTITEESNIPEAIREFEFFKTGRSTYVVVKKKQYEDGGEYGLDIRKYVDGKNYQGWTQKGINIPYKFKEDLIKLLQKV